MEACMSALENLVELVKFRMSTLNSGVDVKNIEKALYLSLSAFNMMPCVTYFKFGDEENINQISDLLVTYASYILLTTQSLVERGKEFAVEDNGVGFIPPSVSDHLIIVSRELWNSWYSRVKDLKQSDSFYEDFVREGDEE